MKENKQPLLSICIPTRNRWYSLQYTLKSIMEQDDFKSWAVEIVISDNASTDETEIEVWKLCKKYKNIRYFRNKENIWSNPNINRVLSLWEWEYLWLLWSDDLILEWWLTETLIFVKKYNPDLLLHKNNGIPRFKLINNKDNSDFLLFHSQKEYFEYLWKQYLYDRHSFIYLENLKTFMSLICINSQYYKRMISNIFSDEYRRKAYNKFYFSQNLISHFDELLNSIVCLNIPFISSVDSEVVGNQKKTWYVTSLWIVRDAVKMDIYVYRKYNLSKTYIALAFKSFLFWFWQFVLGKLKIIFNWRYSKKIFSFVWNIIFK